MNIKYSPISEPVSYKIDGEIIYIKARDEVRKIDFSKVPNGKLVSMIDYLSEAERVDGELTVTLRQPLDKEDKELPAMDDFDTSEAEEINYEWKSWEEIEKEENKPSELELLKQENQTLALAIMELGKLILNGGK